MFHEMPGSAGRIRIDTLHADSTDGMLMASGDG
jgi:hypothetical protein